MSRRVFQVADHRQPNDGEPIRSVVHETDLAAVVACGPTLRIAAGDIAVAPVGAVHGVLNSGSQDLIFVSVVSPAGAGFELL